MSSTALALTGMDTAKLTVSGDFIRDRDEVLESAAAILEVTDEASQAEAVRILSKLRGLRLEVSGTKDKVKRPIIDLGKKIEEIAKTAIGIVPEEEDRIKKAVGDYQEKLRAEAARIEAERLAEERRQREEAEAAQREIERKQKEAEEALQRAESLKTAEAREKANKAAQEAADEAERLQFEADAEAHEAEQANVVTEIQVAAPIGGMKADEVDDFEVLDVVALVKAYPGLCTIEPKRRLILEAIANGQTDLPGVRIFKRQQIKITR